MPFYAQGLKMVCPTCQKAFHDGQSLKKHVDAVHLKLKRMCPVCGVTVTALAVHMNAVHTGIGSNLLPGTVPVQYTNPVAYQRG